MNVMLRSDPMPDVAVLTTTWEYYDLVKLDRHIRTMLAARRWLKREKSMNREPKK